MSYIHGCYGILVKRKNISAIAVEILQEKTKHYELDSYHRKFCTQKNQPKKILLGEGWQLNSNAILYNLVPRAFLRREEGGPFKSKPKTSLGHACKCPTPPRKKKFNFRMLVD